MKKENIAINFRGMLRTWDKCKFSLFSTFDLLEKNFNIIYFIDTWDKQQYTQYFHNSAVKEIVEIKNEIIHTESLKHKLYEDFAGKNLVLNIHNQESPQLVNSTSYAKICYLNSLSVLKFEIENDIKFKFSINLRPDLFICHPDIAAGFLLRIFLKKKYTWMILDDDAADLDELHFHFPTKRIYNVMGGKMEQDQMTYGPTDILRFADDHYFRRAINKNGFIRAHHDLGNHLDEYSIPSNHDLPFRVILTRDYLNIPIENQHDYMHDWHIFNKTVA